MIFRGFFSTTFIETLPLGYNPIKAALPLWLEQSYVGASVIRHIGSTSRMWYKPLHNTENLIVSIFATKTYRKCWLCIVSLLAVSGLYKSKSIKVRKLVHELKSKVKEDYAVPGSRACCELFSACGRFCRYSVALDSSWVLPQSRVNSCSGYGSRWTHLASWAKFEPFKSALVKLSLKLKALFNQKKLCLYSLNVHTNV